MKVMTILGTRPEIIRLSRVIPLLDQSAEHVLVHTGQNHDERLSRLFFDELGVRAPDESMELRAATAGAQIGQILEQSEGLLRKHRPDRLLVLGDTNSGLSAMIARRLGIPVYHMEAGNRCYDDRVPEEINRRVIDHCSTVLLPYTQRSMSNLVREGIERHRIFVTGNPIFEVLNVHRDRIDARDVLTRLGLREREYFLVTLHRAENVDLPERLSALVDGLSRVADRYEQPLIVSVHPRTADKLAAFGISPASARIRLLAPLGFFDFVHLEKRARCVLTDSGTVQEECCILRVPNVTVRDVTERPETIEAGSSILSGSTGEGILRGVAAALATPPDWTVPSEYLEPQVSRTVVKLLVGYRWAE
jgi:UDP-N-acetylglucosamine 2-epimerase (non-hydrolysing)